MTEKPAARKASNTTSGPKRLEKLGRTAIRTAPIALSGMSTTTEWTTNAWTGSPKMVSKGKSTT